MEVAKELKRLTNDAYTIGLYDEEEERRRIENSIKITAKKQGHEQGLKQGLKQGVKQGVKQGAKEREKTIAKNLLEIGIPINDIIKATGLSKKQIAMLM